MVFLPHQSVLDVHKNTYLDYTMAKNGVIKMSRAAINIVIFTEERVVIASKYNFINEDCHYATEDLEVLNNSLKPHNLYPSALSINVMIMYLF